MEFLAEGDKGSFWPKRYAVVFMTNPKHYGENAQQHSIHV